MKILSITQVRHAEDWNARYIRCMWKVRWIFFYLPSGFALSDMNGRWVSGKKSLASSCPWKYVIWLKALAFLSLCSNEETKHFQETKRVNSTAVKCHFGSDKWAVVWWPISYHSYVHFHVAPIIRNTWPGSSPAVPVSINSFGSEKREWVTM